MSIIEKYSRNKFVYRIKKVKSINIVIRNTLILYFTIIIIFAFIYYFVSNYWNCNALTITNQATTESMLNNFRKISYSQSIDKLSSKRLNNDIIEGIINKDYNNENVIRYNKYGEIIDVSLFPFDDYGNVNEIELSGDIYKVSMENDLLIKTYHNNVDTIGEEWSSYYLELFLSNHFTTYTIDEIASIHLFDTQKSRVPESNYKYIKIHLYNNGSTQNIPLVLFMSEGEYYKIDRKMDLSINNNKCNIDDLKQIFPSCINYLDKEFVVAQKYQNLRPTLVDCFYFSIITITTTGYGDILPNDILVRILVIFEIFIGLIIMGFLGSSIWQRFINKNVVN